MILLLVLGGLLLSAALPLREYLRQRGQIDALQSAQTAQRARLAELQAEKQRWQDPAYVAAQARRRLGYVLPGETAYVLIEPSPSPQPGTAAAESGDGPWYSQLWGTAQAADRPSAAPTPSP